MQVLAQHVTPELTRTKVQTKLDQLDVVVVVREHTQLEVHQVAPHVQPVNTQLVTLVLAQHVTPELTQIKVQTKLDQPDVIIAVQEHTQLEVHQVAPHVQSDNIKIKQVNLVAHHALRHPTVLGAELVEDLQER